jgi:hypothetical protein
MFVHHLAHEMPFAINGKNNFIPHGRTGLTMPRMKNTLVRSLRGGIPNRRRTIASACVCTMRRLLTSTANPPGNRNVWCGGARREGPPPPIFRQTERTIPLRRFRADGNPLPPFLQNTIPLRLLHHAPHGLAPPLQARAHAGTPYPISGGSNGNFEYRVGGERQKVSGNSSKAGGRLKNLVRVPTCDSMPTVGASGWPFPPAMR